MTQRRWALVSACAAALLGGCALADATAGAAVSVAGAVLCTGVQLTGKAVGAGIDALGSSSDDGSGIVVREHIRAVPTPAAGELNDAPAAGAGPQDPDS